jgi:hypothetical protein
MRRIFYAAVFCVPTFIIAHAFWHGSGQTCDVTKNANADFGAVGSGLVDDTAAFVGTGSFLDFAINTYQPANPGKTICFTENAGNRYFFGAGAGSLFNGVTNLVFTPNGATMTNALNLTAVSGSAGQPVLTFSGAIPSGVTAGMLVIDDTNQAVLDGTLTVQSINSGAHTVTLNGNIAAPGAAGHVISFKGNGFALGTNGQTIDAAHTALTQTVAAGATSVTLVTSADTSKFTVNTWNFMAGDVIQGGGAPINQFFHEFVFITNINVGTGQITFQSPLKFGYKSTWPGSGAAALWVMPASWNVTQVYSSGAYIGWDGPGNTLLNSNGRTITYNGPVFTAFGANISQNQNVTFNDTVAPNIAFWEVDKLWEAATFNRGTIHGFQFFSASGNDTLTLNNVNVTQAVIGSPGVFNINNSTLSGIKPGATSNGITSAINCTNSNLGAAGIFDYAGIIDTAITAANGVTITTGGLMTIPLAIENPVTWAVPGADMFLSNSASGYVVPFSVTDVTGDGTNTYVQTTLSGYAALPAAVTGVRAAVAKTINFSGCTGSTSVLDWSQVGAQNARPATYSNRIYTCTNGIAAQQAAHPGVPVIDLNSTPTTDPLMTRALSSLIVAVSQADTGAAVGLHIGGPFDNGQVFNGSLVGSTWAPVVDLKTTGTRTYTGSTNTWSGSAGVDSLTTTTPGFPSYIGIQGAFRPSTSRDVSGEAANACPIVTFTIQTSANDNSPLSAVA